MLTGRHDEELAREDHRLRIRRQQQREATRRLAVKLLGMLWDAASENPRIAVGILVFGWLILS